MPSPTASKLTTDHEEIRRWAKKRDAVPATVSEAERGDSATLLRLKLPGRNGGVSMRAVAWEVWLRKFERQKLAFLYQDQIANGEPSNYNEIVSREIADEVESAVGGKGRSASRRGSLRIKNRVAPPSKEGIPSPVHGASPPARRTRQNRKSKLSNTIMN